MNELCNKMKYFEETEGIKRKVYYHYTSLDALYSIVQSHTFRLMSLKSSNDKMELYYTPQLFLTDLKRIYEEEQNENTKAYYKIVLDSAEKHKSEFFNYFKKKPQPYAL